MTRATETSEREAVERISCGRAGGTAVRPPVRRRRLLGTVVDFLVEPLEPSDGPVPPSGAFARRGPARPVIAVVGLAPGCGATTVARALGAELAVRDPAAAAVVSAASVPSGGVPLGTAPAVRLARSLGRRLSLAPRAVGRLCLAPCVAIDGEPLVAAARPLAPVVLDVGDPAAAAIAAGQADAVVLVATPAIEPSLAEVVGESLARVGPRPVVALNRARGGGRWSGRCDVRLPEARVGAQLAGAGREPRGDLGRAVAALAELLGEEDDS